jgi:cell division septum initiation protein DivIVA
MTGPSGRVELIRELRAVLQEARSMPMSASAVVNRAEILGLLDGLEMACELEMDEAREVLSARDHVIADARQEAEQILHEARLEQDRLVSDTEVFRSAQRRAEEELAGARAEADALRREADEYVDGKLAGFEISMQRILDTVQRGRQRLAGRSELDALREGEGDDGELPEHLRS